MGAVWFRTRVELRTRWRAVLVLGAVAGLAGALVLASLAAARRTDTAFARLVRATDAADVLVNPDYGNNSLLDLAKVAALPMVSDAGVEHGATILPLPIRQVS